MAFRKVAILGLGKVGHLAAELLAASGFSVLGVDAREKKKDTPVPVRVADLADCKEIADILGGQEAVLSCLPYHLNKNVASAAHASPGDRLDHGVIDMPGDGGVVTLL